MANNGGQCSPFCSPKTVGCLEGGDGERGRGVVVVVGGVAEVSVC